MEGIKWPIRDGDSEMTLPCSKAWPSNLRVKPTCFGEKLARLSHKNSTPVPVSATGGERFGHSPDCGRQQDWVVEGVKGDLDLWIPEAVVMMGRSINFAHTGPAGHGSKAEVKKYIAGTPCSSGFFQIWVLLSQHLSRKQHCQKWLRNNCIQQKSPIN